MPNAGVPYQTGSVALANAKAALVNSNIPFNEVVNGSQTLLFYGAAYVAPPAFLPQVAKTVVPVVLAPRGDLDQYGQVIWDTPLVEAQDNLAWIYFEADVVVSGTGEGWWLCSQSNSGGMSQILNNFVPLGSDFVPFVPPSITNAIISTTPASISRSPGATIELFRFSIGINSLIANTDLTLKTDMVCSFFNAAGSVEFSMTDATWSTQPVHRIDLDLGTQYWIDNVTRFDGIQGNAALNVFSKTDAFDAMAPRTNELVSTKMRLPSDAQYQRDVTCVATVDKNDYLIVISFELQARS